jgi:hypothetical protein
MNWVSTFSIISGVVCASVTASAQVAVLTYHNDNARTGQNLLETILTPSKVNVNSFGKRFMHPVDGQIYAQPLYVPNVPIAGKGTHNVVFVVTENDSVYAFDADNAKDGNAAALWKAPFVNPAKGSSSLSTGDVSCSDISPQIGITGTPVIERSTGTLWVVAKTKEVSGETTNYSQRLHAVDITSGKEKLGGPFLIRASQPGNCSPTGNGRVAFSAQRANQRAGLALSKGYVYVAWASHCDFNPYSGWVMAFSAATGDLRSAFNTAPDSGIVSYECRAGVWQSGAAPAADSSGNLFFATGNGYFDANEAGGLDYGDSQVKLSLSSGGLNVSDYFTPYNQSSLDSVDTDLGSGGVLLLPPQSGAHPNLLLSAGKEGTLYLVDRDDMGKYNASGDTQIVQEVTNAVGGVFGMPAYFNGAVYIGAGSDSLKAFSLTDGKLATSPTTHSSFVFGFPGTTPSISANGSTNGIVWALDTSAAGSGGPAVLHAFDATNLANELYNSSQNASRDQLGPAVKFAVPTVANGKVYVGTGNSLTVFGLQ